MEDIDRPADIQVFPKPAGASCTRVNVETARGVVDPKRIDRIGGHRGLWRYLRQELAVRAPELERAVGTTLHSEAFLVKRAMMPATEESEVRERGGAALRPVADVVALASGQTAAREAASLVSMV
jgi:hypothetical protein